MHPVGGISTLPLSKHSSNQSSISTNFWIDDDFNLSRRNATILQSDFVSDKYEPYTYAYDRGDGEYAYLIVIDSAPIDFNPDIRQGQVTVIDQDGNTYNPALRADIYTPTEMLDYLKFPANKTPKEVFKVVTIKDTAFIVNTTKKVLPLETDRCSIESYLSNWAIWVKQVNTASPWNYKLYFNGDFAEKRSDNSWEILIDIGLSMPQGTIRMNQEGNVGFGKSGMVNELTWTDDAGGVATSLLYKYIDRLEDTPSHLDEIEYDWFYEERNDGEPFYVVWEWTNEKEEWIITEVTRTEPEGLKLPTGTTLPPQSDYDTNKKYIILNVKEGLDDGYYICHDRGEWRECPDPYDKIKRIDKRTMPLMLKPADVKNADSFALYWMELAEKYADVVSPPFINDYIHNIVYTEGRLGLLTSNYISLSQVIDNPQINFFNRTARDVLPDDPLFYGIATSKNEKIIETRTFQFGLYIFTTDGIYINRLNNNEGNLSNQIVKVLDLKIEHVEVYGSAVVFVSKNRLYIADEQGQIREISQHFRKLISGVRDLVTYKERDMIFILVGDNNILLVQNLESCFEWTIYTGKIYSIEVANDSLVLVNENGISYIPLDQKDTTNYKDDGTDIFESTIELPSNLLGDGKTWGKFWWKRLEVFGKDSSYKVEISRKDDTFSGTEVDTSMNETVLNGNNFDTSIFIKSVDDSPLDIELIRFTVDIEPQIRIFK